MNAAMQTMMATFKIGPQAGAAHRQDGRSGEQSDDPFAHLLQRIEARLEGVPTEGSAEEAVVLVHEFLKAHAELSRSDATETPPDAVLEADAPALQSSPAHEAPADDRATDVFMQALAAILADSDAAGARDEDTGPEADLHDEDAAFGGELPFEAVPPAVAQDAEEQENADLSVSTGMRAEMAAMQTPASAVTERPARNTAQAPAETARPAARMEARLDLERAAPEQPRAPAPDANARPAQQAAAQFAVGGGTVTSNPAPNATAFVPSATGPAATLDDGNDMPRVSVVSHQTSISPLPLQQMPLSQTGQSVVQAVETAAPMRTVQADMATMLQQRAAQTGTTTLKIQLQPVDLGMITAKLTTTGSQLSIEIQVENSDARQRLSSESDAIMKAMRSIGYDVDRITIQQNQPAPQQPNGGQQQSARDFANPNQQFGDEGERRGGSERGAGEGSRGQNGGSHETAQAGSGGGVYI